VPALEGSPNAARWPAAKAPIFLCGSDITYRQVMAAVPASLVSQEAPAAGQPPAAEAG
jgi:hypothetical protein